VGETFECTLCINNELNEGSSRTVTSVKLSAEMQTPSQTVSISLGKDHERAAQEGLSFGESLQTIVRFDLREDGSHTLVVSVSYNESLHSNNEQAVSGGRVRSFRKLYQFLAVSLCISEHIRHILNGTRALACRSEQKHLISRVCLRPEPVWYWSSTS
jgi:trafficking protein particle complex subunit 13